MTEQPRDPNHPLYTLLKLHLVHGDNKAISTELEVNESLVSNVRCGRDRSKRVWNKLLETALRRKKDQDRIAKNLDIQTISPPC